MGKLDSMRFQPGAQKQAGKKTYRREKLAYKADFPSSKNGADGEEEDKNVDKHNSNL